MIHYEIMETRKIQSTGGSSYSITLPKNWIELNNLKKNDNVFLKINQNGCLEISSSGKNKKGIKKICVDENTPYDNLYRELIASYISGYASIEIVSENNLTPTHSLCAMDFCQKTMGFLITNETTNEIKIEDVSLDSIVDYKKNLYRMKILVENMLSNLIDFLKIKNKIVLTKSANIEIGRIDKYITRQTKMEDPSYSGALFASHMIKRISKNINLIAEYCSEIEDECALETMAIIFEEMNLNEILGDSINNIIHKNMNNANLSISMCQKLIDKLDEFEGISELSEDNTKHEIKKIMFAINNIIEYFVNINELAIEFAVGDYDENN